MNTNEVLDLQIEEDEVSNLEEGVHNEEPMTQLS
jgi:hypothetical protein